MYSPRLIRTPSLKLSWNFCTTQDIKDSPHRQTFVAQWPLLLEHLAHHPLLQHFTETFVRTSITNQLTSEVAHLAEKESGWHFSAKNATTDQLESFTIDGMSSRMQSQAPALSSLLDCLLDSKRDRTSCRKEHSDEASADEGLGSTAETGGDLDEEEEYWLGEEVDIEGPREEDASMDVDDSAVTGGGSVEGEKGCDDANEQARAARLKKRRLMAQKRKTALLAIVSFDILLVRSTS